ncbi:unnamed protein product [Brassicogethes aeneus]|uniref:Glutamate receptor 1 n=1 Tax=Brassicogethes aeneus TaxID=1431903 RepID=A0A9P0FFZ9_BRAAE|nr:unnamed protein product [Brassicogethes aeneus]
MTALHFGRVLLGFVLVFVAITQKCLGRKLHIGLFLDEDDLDNQTKSIALQSAMYRIKLVSQYRIEPHYYYLKSTDYFKTEEKACKLLKQGVAAIFGPESPELNDVIQSISTALEIPHFQTLWNPKSGPPTEKFGQIFNMFPSANTLAQAVATLIRESDWKTYTIVYEDETGLIRLQEALTKREPLDPIISYRKLGPGPDHRSILKEIKNSGESQIILDCKIDNIINILKQAKEVNLLEEYHSYILTNLDAHTLNWKEFENIRTNITAIRLIDPNSSGIKDVIRDWHLTEENQQYTKYEIGAESVRVKTALLFDAINLFINSFAAMEEIGEKLPVKQLSCNRYDIASHGNDLSAFIHRECSNNLTENPMLDLKMCRNINVTNNIFAIPSYPRKERLPGPLSGLLQFDEYGQRNYYQLQIIELVNSGFRVTSTWNPDVPDKLYETVTTEEREKEYEKQLTQKNFRVVSRLGAPYLIRVPKPPGKLLRGNDRFEGYAVDLMHKICGYLNCSFTFEVVEDGSYGNYNPEKKEWNGLIRQLLDRKADLAVCDLTITYERRKAVDFTMPFMTLGISILYAKTVKEPQELLSFTNPLSLDVWLYMATAYIVMSMLIFLVARLNPNDWENPHPCDPCPQELENIWDIKNCCWLTLGSIMNQGCDIMPKGISTRMVAGMWWFFSLIMTACYTANLAAFLTMERMGPTIESAEDLAGQTKIKYGCLSGGATYSFFRDSNFSTYHRMFVQMESADPSVFEKDNKDGVKRVLTSNRKYAFLMESSSIEYEMERNCDLIQVGGLLDSKGYGIAMPTNAQYRKQINEAILKMQESGTLTQLKDKWWKEMHGGGQCKEDKHSSEATATELGLDHVGGVFVVLIGGVFVALSIAVCEFLWNVRKIAVDGQMTLKDAFDSELKFAMDIWARKKASKPTSQTVSLEKLSNKIK